MEEVHQVHFSPRVAMTGTSWGTSVAQGRPSPWSLLTLPGFRACRPAASLQETHVHDNRLLRPPALFTVSRFQRFISKMCSQTHSGGSRVSFQSVPENRRPPGFCSL